MATGTFKQSLKRAVLVLPLMASVSGTALPQVMMSSDTETALAQDVRLPGEVIDLIIKSEPDDARLLEECRVNDGHGPIPVADLFSAMAIRLNQDDLPDYFVRPALKPYCGAFYGAHLFRYWFVTSHRQHGSTRYRIVYKGGSDEVRVLNRFTNGYRDLEVVSHTAVQVATSTWRFDGKQYLVAGCILRSAEPEKMHASGC